MEALKVAAGMRIAVSIVVAILMTGCQPSYTLTTAFDPAAASYILQAGDSRIEGQAFLRTMIGEVRYAAGSLVVLVPVTPYTSERMRAFYGERNCSKFGAKFTNENAELHNYVRKTKADGEGRFSFEGISAGEYFVATEVYWQIPNAIIPEGCRLYTRTAVASGQSTKVIIDGTQN